MTRIFDLLNTGVMISGQKNIEPKSAQKFLISVMVKFETQARLEFILKVLIEIGPYCKAFGFGRPFGSRQIGLIIIRRRVGYMGKF